MSEYTQDRRYGFDPQSLTTQLVNYTASFPRSDNTFISSRIPAREINAYEENRFVSTYFNLGYNFRKRYKLSGSYRLDDSNLFGASPEYRNIPLWSVGAAWDIKNENFFNSKLIDRLVLRATLGTGGNIDRSTSPLTILQSSVNTITGRGGPGDRFAFLRNPPNPTLRWEKTTTQNIGIDFSLFNNRFYGSVEYYKRMSEDLLLQTDFNPTYGIASALYNTASMSNKGMDLNLNVQVTNKKFNWVSTINFSINKNTVESVNFNNSSVPSYFNAAPRVGKPLNHLYSYNWAGLSTTGTSQVYDSKGNIIGANDIYTFVPDDLQYGGEIITPKIYGGFINAFSYKNFSLTAILTYKAGHKFIKNSGDLLYTNYLNSTPNFVPKEFEQRWKKAGDEKITDVPVLKDPGNGNITSFYNLGSQQVLNASHIRLTQITFSYNLPKKLSRLVWMKDLRFDLQMRNLGVIVFNREGIDPENNFYNTDYIPRVPEFTFSINANF